MWGRYSNTLIRWHYEFKKSHLETSCILVYKTNLFKKNITYPFRQTILHSLSQTCHITNDHNHCCLHDFNGAASFYVECESIWGPTGKLIKHKEMSGGAVCTSPVPSTWPNVSFQKCLFVHKQVWDMQTSTLSRNNTREVRKKLRDGDALIEDTRTHSTVWWFFVCHQQYGHTDIVGQGHFFKHSIRNQSRCWLTEIFPGVHIFPLSSQRGECWSLLAVKRLFYQTSSSFDTA